MSTYGGYLDNVQQNIPSPQNCQNLDTSNKKSFDTFRLANINDDKLTVDLDNLVSQGPGLYHLDNQFGCECSLKEAREIQTSQPGIHLKGGVGWIAENGCLVDNDSTLRQSKDMLTNKNDINQIVERLFLTTPNLKKGRFNVDLETVLINSDSTTEQKPCDALSGVSIGNYFTPMIPKLSEEVQDTNHIIPEDSRSDWLRGGLPSRQIVRNADYLRRCQEKTFQ
jgi:hypothetical protein